MTREPTPNAHAARRRKHDPADSDAHAHRREADEGDMARLHGRMDDAEHRVDGVEQTIVGLAAGLNELNKTVARAADGLEALSNLKGFVLTMKLFSAAAKIMLPLLAVLAAVTLFVKTGQWDLRL